MMTKYVAEWMVFCYLHKNLTEKEEKIVHVKWEKKMTLKHFSIENKINIKKKINIKI